MNLDDIDFNAPEDSDEIRRPFRAKIEASVAVDFINTVRANGWYVRETLVKLMREFSRRYGKPNE